MILKKKDGESCSLYKRKVKNGGRGGEIFDLK
jgi:hypothetical protein